MPETKRRRRPGVRPRVSREGEGVWTAPEHERFLQARRLFPTGPWKLVAQFIGTRSTRQTMTHAQKFRQKLQRRRRGLRRSRRDATERVQEAGDPVVKFQGELKTEVKNEKPVSPVPSPLVAAQDPTALLFGGDELRFQDLLLLPVDTAAKDEEEHLPPLCLTAWEEPLPALDGGCGSFKASPTDPSDFPGLDDALDYILQSL
jgi:hypothetical protein